MTTAHQQFSARTRQSGELDKPEGRRRNLATGRLSVIVGPDAACVLEHMAAEEERSVGGFIRRIVMLWFEEKHGMDAPALAARAAALREARINDDASE